MPFAFPTSPTLNQQWPTENPRFQWDGVKWRALGGGLPFDVQPVTLRYTSLLGSDDFIALRGVDSVPGLVSTDVMAATFGGEPPAATAPAAMTAGQWTAEPTVTPGEIGINIVALPNDGGSPITALQYRVGTGAATALTGTGTGLRVVTAGFAAGVAADIQVRAVNAIGAGAWSDTKTRTPAAGGGGGMQWLAPGAAYYQSSPQTTHTIAVPAGLQVGDMLLLATYPWGTISSVQTSTGQSLALLATYSQAGEVGRIHGVVIAGSVPTSINITMATANAMQAQTIAARGVTQVAGTVLNGNAAPPIDALTYNTDAASALVLSFVIHNPANTMTGYTPVGGSGTAHAKWPASPAVLATGAHSGPTGLNNAAITWSVADTNGGRWMSLALRP